MNNDDNQYRQLCNVISKNIDNYFLYGSFTPASHTIKIAPIVHIPPAIISAFRDFLIYLI